MTYDLAVVGAGPAGLTAARVAAKRGLRVALLDAYAAPGGQFLRGTTPPRLTGVDVMPGQRVWAVETSSDGFRVHASTTTTATTLLVATGAHDTVVPFPGWDLPGVLTAGGAQALVKGERIRPGEEMVVAGTGPFLLPVAVTLLDAGVRVKEVLEANRPSPRMAAALALVPSKAREALGYARRLAEARVPYRTGHAVVAAHGEDSVEGVTVARLTPGWRPYAWRTVDCDTVAVGYGFTPQVDLLLQLGCAVEGDHVVVDDRQRTSVEGVLAAGEVTGVGGAASAVVEGALAVHSLVGEPPPRLLAEKARLRRFARALDLSYPVRDGWRDWLTPDTVVCRCEEVTLRAIDEARDLGAHDPRTLKLLARTGMGWCQGRMCGHAVAALTGHEPAPQKRPFAQPITLADLTLHDREDNA
ncbi:FAD-dependent oxidoreductase [Herbidospora cretacea]|uniref:FAD-dependent oxidoreductase n=1 Tax=Herbidospora cretacea TaxID=28444 RepID=UPI0004C3E0EF|nr:FAD-dependent oxidoreductase [Herbidospora cretacea]